jgi:2-deoxy-D-gluconate 3-dehydrogenase
LSGKIAIVTGCRTGLGQGMACGPAEVGADIVGVDLKDSSETQSRIEGMGRRSLGIKADLSRIEPVKGIIREIVDSLSSFPGYLSCENMRKNSSSTSFAETFSQPYRSVGSAEK